MLKIIGFFLIGMTFFFQGSAEEVEDASTLTLERIFSSKEFSTKRTKYTKWMEEGSGYTTMEPSESGSGGQDIVLYRPGNNKGSVLVSSEMFVPENMEIPLDVYDYLWSPDGNKILLFTNTRKVWRYHTRGDFWVLDLKKKHLKKLGEDFEEASLMFATFSPDSKKVAYVVHHDIFVETLDAGSIVRLTVDGSDDIINGTFDWVYEEEFSLRNGLRWSPDSRFIAFWRLDASKVRDFYLINNTDSLYSIVTPMQYPKAGTPNSEAKLGVVPAKGGSTVWMKLDGEATNHYLPFMDWADNSDEIVFQRMNRLQNTNKLYYGNRVTGECRVIMVDTDDAWLDVVDDFQFFEKGNKYLWVSERDGWRKVFLYSRDGQSFECITPGSFDVISLVKIDSSEEWVYFTASPDNPTERYLYRASLKQPGTVERITPEKRGTHQYSISSEGKFARHTFSTFDTPPVTDLVSLPDHTSLQILEDNSNLNNKLNTIKKMPVEFFRIKTEDNVELDGWCMKPYDFDPSKKHPVLCYVYGEPGSQTVLNRWSRRGYLWHTMLTQMGYIVVSLDNRGTPSPRGRDFRKCVYGEIGVLASRDQAMGVKALLKDRLYMDGERVAIWGWSGGGSQSLNSIFRYPEVFSTAMAVAPVSDQRFYDTIYQERYMGLPDDNKNGYEKGSPIHFAKHLEGNLLIVHGTGDDNVHYQNTEVLINELVKHNKVFSLMIYPNRTHGISEGENTTRHVYETLTSYLKEKNPVNDRETVKDIVE